MTAAMALGLVADGPPTSRSKTIYSSARKNIMKDSMLKSDSEPRVTVHLPHAVFAAIEPHLLAHPRASEVEVEFSHGMPSEESDYPLAGTTFSSRGGGGGVGASRTQDACLLDSASDVEESAETENRVTVEEEGDSLGVEVADDGDENIVEKRRSGGRVRRGRSRGSLSSSRTGGTRRGRGSQRAPSRAHGDAEEEEEEDDDDDDISTGLDGLHALMHHAEAMSASKPVEEGGLQPPSTSPGPSSDKAGGKRGASRKPSTNKFANSGVPKQSSTTSEDGEVEDVGSAPAPNSKRRKRSGGSVPRDSKGREIRLGAWTVDEDDLLRVLVGKLGTRQWAKIADQMTGRRGKQCRERWFNHLDPSVNRNPFSDTEDQQLLVLHGRLGNQWSYFSRCMIGRTANALKNHWNSTLKRTVERNEHLSVVYETAKRQSQGVPMPECSDDPLAQMHELCRPVFAAVGFPYRPEQPLSSSQVPQDQHPTTTTTPTPTTTSPSPNKRAPAADTSTPSKDLSDGSSSSSSPSAPPVATQQHQKQYATRKRGQQSHSEEGGAPPTKRSHVGTPS